VFARLHELRFAIIDANAFCWNDKLRKDKTSVSMIGRALFRAELAAVGISRPLPPAS
jgi:hypothetical protein